MVLNDREKIFQRYVKITAISLIAILAACLFPRAMVYTRSFPDEYWKLGKWNNGEPARVVDGYVVLEVNETEGMWSNSRLFRGVQPHGWHAYGDVPHIKIARCGLSKLIMLIKISVSDFEYYGNDSYVNAGVCLWLQLDDKYDLPIEVSHQLVVDFYLIKTHNGELLWDTGLWQGNGTDYDYHYSWPLNKVEENARPKYVVLDLTKGIRKALKELGMKSAILRAVEIYLEAKNGYGRCCVYSVIIIAIGFLF